MVMLSSATSALPRRRRVSQPTRGQNCQIAIAARGIDMVYASKAQRFQALKAVDLDVAAGTVHLLMGPTGAGKTTLLMIVAGLLTPTRGQVTLLGHTLSDLSRHDVTLLRLQTMGIVFPEHNLLHALTALENVELALHLKGIHGTKARREAQRLLEAVGLGNRSHVLSRRLSLGQQQRISIARALAGHPRLIIADEPTSALDSANGRLISTLFHQLAKTEGAAVLVATHDHRMIAFADRISYLEDGQITSATSPSL